MTKEPFFVPRRTYHHGGLKDALIEAARHLMAERGPAGFSLAEAAKRVGVTNAAPYRHFSDRNALVSELARRGFDLFAIRLEDAAAANGPDPLAALQAMGDAYLAFAREEPGLYSAMFASAMPLQEPGPSAAAGRALATLERGTAAVLRVRGLSGRDPHPLALQIWALSHGVASLIMSGHLPGDAGGDAHRTLREGVGALLASATRT